MSSANRNMTRNTRHNRGHSRSHSRSHSRNRTHSRSHSRSRNHTVSSLIATAAAANASRAQLESAASMGKHFNIGIDFGGVLSSHDAKIGAQHVNTAIDMPLAIENLLKLKHQGHHLFLISFCGKNRAIETKQSLIDTPIMPGSDMKCASLFEKMYFTPDRKYKKEICEFLNCHFMVDDRSDIQEVVITSECHTIPILFGEEHHPTFIAAKNWDVVTGIISSTPFFDTTIPKKELKKKMVFDI